MKANTVIVCTLVVFVILLQESVSRHMGCVDHSVNQCHNILQPHHCYNEYNRGICCATCRRFRTGIPGCPWGDKNAVIKRDGSSYTCRGYVGHFGRTRCDDVDFYRLCCGSCQQ